MSSLCHQLFFEMFFMGAGDVIFCRVPRSSFRVMRRSVGCIAAQKGASQLRREQRSSDRCSVAQKGVA